MCDVVQKQLSTATGEVDSATVPELHNLYYCKPFSTMTKMLRCSRLFAMVLTIASRCNAFSSKPSASNNGLQLQPDGFGDWMMDSNNGKDYNSYAMPLSGAQYYRMARARSGPSPSEADVAWNAFHHRLHGNRRDLRSNFATAKTQVPVVVPPPVEVPAPISDEKEDPAEELSQKAEAKATAEDLLEAEEKQKLPRADQEDALVEEMLEAMETKPTVEDLLEPGEEVPAPSPPPDPLGDSTEKMNESVQPDLRLEGLVTADKAVSVPPTTGQLDESTTSTAETTEAAESQENNVLPPMPDQAEREAVIAFRRQQEYEAFRSRYEQERQFIDGPRGYQWTWSNW